MPAITQFTVRSGPDLGRAVGEIRRARNLTQEELAALTGISRSSLAQLERGRQGRTINLLLRLLRRLGATVTISVDADPSELDATVR